MGKENYMERNIVSYYVSYKYYLFKLLYKIWRTSPLYHISEFCFNKFSEG
jgi:hypothetical protein